MQEYMCEQNLIQQLLHTFPELTSSYNEYMEWWDGEDPGLHNLMGDVLGPYMRESLELDTDPKLIKRIFAFLERMATSPDEAVVNVLMVTLLERLGDDKKLLERAYAYMSPYTREASDEIEQYWGRK